MIKVIIILIVLLIVTKKALLQNENFIDSSKPNIWMYWENKSGKTKPEYLQLCYQTIQKNCKNSFNINLLDEKTVYKYLPNLRKDLDEYLNIPQKTDYIRLALLYKYGGIWIDSDTIVIKDMKPLWNKTKKYEFIGFGCTGYHCNSVESGYPRPSNWVLISRKGGLLMKECLKEADLLIKDKPYIFKYKYHIMGRMLLWTKIKELLKTKKWDYLHMPSKCIERDSIGNKYVNNRLISDQEYDKKCKGKIYFLPIYNTAPGFPEWFLNLSKDELLKSNMLISEMFKYALN